MSQFVLSDPRLAPRESLASRLDDKVHPQTQSPLFSTIPAEIRNRIFSSALTYYDDKTKPYQPQNWFYRPGFHYHSKTSTTLLQTCKLIYLESHLLPLAINSYSFWGAGQRGPPDHYYAKPEQIIPHRRAKPLCEDYRILYDKLNDEQISAVGELHFFMQQYWIDERRFSPNWISVNHKPVSAKKLKFTIRHHDWWDWEKIPPPALAIWPWKNGRASVLDMNGPQPESRNECFRGQGWGTQLETFKGLEVFELEMETVMDRKGEVGGIVERAKGWRFPLLEDAWLVWDEDSGVRESRWEEDDVDLDGDVTPPGETLRELHQRQQVPAVQPSPTVSATPAVPSEKPKRQYYVASLRWKARKLDALPT